MTNILKINSSGASIASLFKRLSASRFSLILCFIVAIQTGGNNTVCAQAKISVSFSEVPIEQALDEIEKQSGYTFLYNDATINSKQKVTLHVKDKDLSLVLPELFSKQNVSYTISGKQIILSADTISQAPPTPFAPASKIKGTISDSNGEPLIGVSILVTGTTFGNVTDIDGNFELNLPDNARTLTVSYMGYATQTVPLAGASIPLNIVMYEDTKMITEVVVTAMGIERKAESLTYATHKISGKELTRAKDVNFINSLQGKSAGLTITPNTSSGAGGGSSKIILRGQSSILGNNQPLIVLDGVPLSNGMSSQTKEVVIGTSRDGGDLLSTINPDDVANISILKGPNAAALYGSAANNGVIIITTKGGQEGKIRVDISSNVTLETPLVYPRLQTEYANEIIGSEIMYNAWGDKIANLTDDQLATFPYLTRKPRNNVTDFFKTGQTYNNSVAISGGSSSSNTYFSYGNTIQKGLIDKNTFERHNVLFKENFHFLDDRATLTLSLNYIRQKTNNAPIIGMAKGSLPGLYRTPSAVDLRYFDQNRTHVAQADDPLVTMPDFGNRNLIGERVQTFPWLNHSWINNPYFMLDAIDDEMKKDRIMANATLKVIIMQGLNAQARFSMDKTNGESVSLEYASIRGDKNQTTTSAYWGANSSHQEVYSDYLLTYEKALNVVSMSATAGTSFKRIYDHDTYTAKYTDTTYVKPNIPWPIEGSNGTKNPERAGSILGANDSGNKLNWDAAVFATAQFGFWNTAYIDLSIRNDWAKAFQQFASKGHYKSFIYYSAGGNVLLKELLLKDLSSIDMVKLRGSYSVVGNSVPAKFYNAQFVDPLTGAVSARNAPFDDPKPETTSAVEFGLDGAFLNYKLDFDLTLYQSIMSNQYLEISTSSGQLKPINSGRVRNRGIEFSSNYRMRFNADFRWITGINLAYNTNKILKTYTPKDGNSVDITIGANSLSMQSKFIEGGAYGDLYGKDFTYENGKIKLVNGKPQISQEYTRFLGNTTAKVTYGWNNTFSYKDLSLYVLLDGKIGGKVISLTESELDRYGLSLASADARKTNGGKVTLPDGQEVTARDYYEALGAEQFDCIYDASNIRLREVSLGYTLYDVFGPSRNLTISLIGRNLGFIFKKSPVDPDVSATAGNTFNGIEMYGLPTTRSFGLNIKLSL
jgi:TonB-linked SusC/RagA family outer membrane protein